MDFRLVLMTSSNCNSTEQMRLENDVNKNPWHVIQQVALDHAALNIYKWVVILYNSKRAASLYSGNGCGVLGFSLSCDLSAALSFFS